MAVGDTGSCSLCEPSLQYRQERPNVVVFVVLFEDAMPLPVFHARDRER